MYSFIFYGKFWANILSCPYGGLMSCCLHNSGDVVKRPKSKAQNGEAPDLYT